jgi:hypothetical protein
MGDEIRKIARSPRSGRLLAFDNLSGLPVWLTDALCRLATGGSFAVRQLYTDDEEMLFEAARPTLLNGIEEVYAAMQGAALAHSVEHGVAIPNCARR